MRDKKCVIAGCGRETDLQCAHVVSRRYMGVRWSPENAVTLCRNHHVFYTHRPLEWAAWVDVFMGAEEHRQLKLRALAITKVDYAEVAMRLGL